MPFPTLALCALQMAALRSEVASLRAELEALPQRATTIPEHSLPLTHSPATSAEVKGHAGAGAGSVSGSAHEEGVEGGSPRAHSPILDLATAPSGVSQTGNPGAGSPKAKASLAAAGGGEVQQGAGGMPITLGPSIPAAAESGAVRVPAAASKAGARRGPGEHNAIPVSCFAHKYEYWPHHLGLGLSGRSLLPYKRKWYYRA